MNINHSVALDINKLSRHKTIELKILDGSCLGLIAEVISVSEHQI